MVFSPKVVGGLCTQCSYWSSKYRSIVLGLPCLDLVLCRPLSGVSGGKIAAFVTFLTGGKPIKKVYNVFKSKKLDLNRVITISISQDRFAYL